MDIYLTNLETGDRLRFPMLPEEISVKFGNLFTNYTILNIGEVKTPNGTSLDTISWSGIFPGEPRKNDPYICEWRDPKEVYKWLAELKTQKGKPVKARLLVTETPINCDVYLNSLTGKPTGGYGDINYSINLIQAKEIKLSTTDEIAAAAATAKALTAAGIAAAAIASGKPLTAAMTLAAGSSKLAAKMMKSRASPDRPDPPAAATYTVVKGDSLWKIAQKTWGKGSDYERLYEANTEILDAHKGGKNMIWPGDILTIPN